MTAYQYKSNEELFWIRHGLKQTLDTMDAYGHQEKQVRQHYGDGQGGIIATDTITESLLFQVEGEINRRKTPLKRIQRWTEPRYLPTEAVNVPQHIKQFLKGCDVTALGDWVSTDLQARAGYVPEVMPVIESNPRKDMDAALDILPPGEMTFSLTLRFNPRVKDWQTMIFTRHFERVAREGQMFLTIDNKKIYMNE